MLIIRFLRSTLLWTTAIILALLPFVVALDFGGILRWTQYASAIVILITTGVVTTSVVLGESEGGIRQHILLLPLLLWLGFSVFQTTALSPGVVEYLSPGSHEAYTGWLEAILPLSDVPASFAISIAAHDSRHACAVLAVLIALVFGATTVFNTRPRITLLLNVIAIGAAMHATYGLLRMVFPRVDLFDSALDAYYHSFGSFINRNNAALFLNFGVGASLGLLSWRLMALTGQEVDDSQFEFNDLASLSSDRDSMIGIASGVFCIGGLLICGSRGGIASVLFGALLAFGWVRQRRGMMSLPIVGAVLAVAAAILLVPLQLNFTSLMRFDFINPEASTLASDGRLVHWPEGLAAAKAHLPFGAGLSTYAFAYLPHQIEGFTGSWAHHADNLWLELFVEQGIIGILLLLSVLVIVIRSLSRLRFSPDPIDQGLRTTGWYFLGAILFSQFFDFGMIMPANLFLTVVFFSAIVSREVAIKAMIESEMGREAQEMAEEALEAQAAVLSDLGEDANSHSDAKGMFTGTSQAVMLCVLAAGIIGIGYLALNQLRRDAEVEWLVNQTEFNIKSIATEEQALKDWSQVLTKNLGDSPEPQLLDALADIEYRRARLNEIVRLRPGSIDKSSELYRLTNPSNRRSSGAKLRSQAEVVENYKVPLDLYARSLRSLPLGMKNRAGQLYLDFVSPDPERTERIIRQLRKLHHNKPKTLILLGEYAANSSKIDFATSLWRTALSFNSGYTQRVIQLTKKHDSIRVIDVVPKEPKSTRKAARILIDSNDPERNEYLPYAIDGIACEDCETLEAKSACIELRGDIAFDLGRYDFAFEQFQLAIQSAPANALLRLKLVRLLRSQGRNAEALIEAKKGRQAIATDKRFDETIRKMADEDLRLIQEIREKEKREQTQNSR